MPFHFSVTAAATATASTTRDLRALLLFDEAPLCLWVFTSSPSSLCWCRYSLGTVINANNSNNNTTLAITTSTTTPTTNNYVHLILLSSCFSHPLQLLRAHVFSTLVYSTPIFLASFSSSQHTVLCLLLLVLLLPVVVVPVDLFFLNTILISAMLPILYHSRIERSHTFFSAFALLLLPFLWFALPHTAASTYSVLRFTSLICLLRRIAYS